MVVGIGFSAMGSSVGVGDAGIGVAVAVGVCVTGSLVISSTGRGEGVKVATNETGDEQETDNIRLTEMEKSASIFILASLNRPLFIPHDQKALRYIYPI